MVLRKKAERIPMKKNIIIPNDTAKTALFNFLIMPYIFLLFCSGYGYRLRLLIQTMTGTGDYLWVWSSCLPQV